jgi:pyridinium-3,5-bisthiocarboxylic acid mononucleotide nickel chelatase
MTLTHTGYGAGSRQLPDRPNVASVGLGAVTPGTAVSVTVAPGEGAAVGSEPGAESLQILATNLDDVSGETLGYVISQALAAGALDAWVTLAVMKKGRPAHVLHVLVRPEDTPALQQLVFAETGALGIRRSTVSRTPLRRHSTTIDLDGVSIRVKHGPHGAKPEHDDLVAAAGALGLPVRASRRVVRALGNQRDQGDAP